MASAKWSCNFADSPKEMNERLQLNQLLRNMNLIRLDVYCISITLAAMFALQSSGHFAGRTKDNRNEAENAIARSLRFHVDCCQ